MRNLHALGRNVMFCEPDVYGCQQYRDIEPPAWAKVHVCPVEDTGAAYSAMERGGRDADVLVKASGVGVFDERLEREILDARRTGASVLFWDVDAPASLVFTYDGSEPVRRACRAAGARECIPGYNAVDPQTPHSDLPDPGYACTLAFAGDRPPDREASVEEFFLNSAARTPEKSFLIAGNGPHDKPTPGNIRNHGHSATADHSAYNCTPTAVLNITRDSMARYGFSPATRVFEAAGSGACPIPDAWEGIEMFLEPGSEVLVARGGEKWLN